MNSSLLIFYLLAAFILGTALLAVTTRYLFRSAIWLLFSLIGIAGFYFLINVPFIAALQIVVYVGGIVVLIIFSIFLTQQMGYQMPKTVWGQQLIAALFAFAALSFVVIQFFNTPFKMNSGANEFDVAVKQVGLQMLHTTQFGFLLPFEVVSLLLLAALVGCIVIAMKKTVPTSINKN